MFTALRWWMLHISIPRAERKNLKLLEKQKCTQDPAVEKPKSELTLAHSTSMYLTYSASGFIRKCKPTKSPELLIVIHNFHKDTIKVAAAYLAEGQQSHPKGVLWPTSHEQKGILIFLWLIWSKFRLLLRPYAFQTQISWAFGKYSQTTTTNQSSRTPFIHFADSISEFHL